MNSMYSSFGATSPSALMIGMVALFLFPIGCGAVGPPIPPEEIGIEAKIREQRQEQAGKKESLAEEQSISPMGEPIELPEFYPIEIR